MDTQSLDGLNCRDAYGSKSDTPLKDEQRSLGIKVLKHAESKHSRRLRWGHGRGTDYSSAYRSLKLQPLYLQEPFVNMPVSVFI